MAEQYPRMPAVYIAGPYRSHTKAGIDANITVAKKVGALASLKGWSAVIPHANTAHLDEVAQLPDEFWLAATMELLRRCDAIVLCPGWQRSSGTLAEVAEAERRGMPIYYTESELPPVEVWRTLPANDNCARG